MISRTDKQREAVILSAEGAKDLLRGIMNG